MCGVHNINQGSSKLVLSAYLFYFTSLEQARQQEPSTSDISMLVLSSSAMWCSYI